MNPFYRQYLMQFGIQFTNKPSTLQGRTMQQTHKWLHLHYAEALYEGEFFHIPSHLLITIITQAGGPIVSDEDLESILRNTFTPHPVAI